MSSHKLEGVQVLRGYAAMLVVVTHLWSIGHLSATLRFARIGGLGVDIFFVISGFIMCYSLKDGSSPGDALQFLKKRAYRVYPIYLLILLPFLIEYFYQGSTGVIRADPILAVGNLLLLPSFFAGESYRMLVGPAWTLSYELLFYLAFAGAMLSARSKTRAICTVILAIVSIVGVVNLLGLKGPRLQWSNFQYMVGDTLFFNFVIGCICYFVWRRYARILFSFWVAIVAAVALTVVSLWIGNAGLPRVMALGLPAGTIVLIFLFSEFKKSTLLKPLLFIGSASYSIYLVEAIATHWKYLFLGRTMHESDLTGILLTTGAVAAGCIFYLIVENPISRFLHTPRGRHVKAPIPVVEH